MRTGEAFLSMLKCSVAASLVAVGLGTFASPALAHTPIISFEALPSTTQAGGHPDLGVQFTVENRELQNIKSACNCEDAKDTTVHSPAGFIANPHATPQCTIGDFSANSCPIDSQVGIVNVVTSEIQFNSAVYNLVPPPDDPGLLGFKVFLFNTPQFEVVSARTGGDYGLDTKATSIYHGLAPLETLQQVLWGVPADPSHDPLRLDPATNQQAPGFTSYQGALCDANGAVSTTADPNTVVEPCPNPRNPTPTPSSSPLTPFLQNPTTCDSSLDSSLDVLSYDGGTTHADTPWPAMTGCSQLSFNPSLYAQPTTTATDSASGIDVNLTIPQQPSPSVPSPTELRAATITLPQGFSINPNAADGKTACSDAEARFGTEEEAHCPEFSKIGSLTIDSSALPGPVPGFVYLGEPEPGNRYRIFLVADGFATHIKLGGTVMPDPVTGRLTVSFQDLPQSPLTAFDMHFFGSERGLLATPTQCGTFPVTSTFTPWDSSLAALSSSQFFSLEDGPNDTLCPGPIRPFNPGFKASSVGNTAGAHTPFSIELTRKDGDQNLTALDVTTPPGFSATLKDVSYCPAAALAAAAQPSYLGLLEEATPSCPAASQIGTSVAGAGAGTHPVYLPGKVYLAGPYQRAPLSLAVITPAVSGPYDLGSVVVRAALQVNPETAQVTAISDPLPRILEGIPLRLRSIRISLDRPNFVLNPTNCEPLSVGAAVFGDEGALANLSSHFQVASCASLPFAPKLSLKLAGGVNRRGHPAIHALVTTQPGEANPSSIAVTLPPNELLDNAHFVSVCTKVDFAARNCPAGSDIGSAEVTTPLLDQPLKGNAYLRSSGRGLPDLALDLQGQFHVVAVARIDSVNGGLRTTFRTVPDVPFGAVSLSLQGGSKGLVQNSESLCSRHFKANVVMGGQNGKALTRKVPLQAACGKHALKRHEASGVHHSRRAG